MTRNFRYFTISYAFFHVAYELVGLYGAISFYVIFDNSFLHAFGVYALIYFLNALLIRPAMSIISRIGTRNGMILANIFFVLSFFPLYQLPQKQTLIIVLWIVLSAIARALYFLAYHYYISILTDEKTRATSLGGFYAMGLLFGILTPFIGGYVSEFYGVQGLAVIMAAFFVISILPLYFVENFKFNLTNSIAKILFSRDTLKLAKMTIINELQAKETVWSIYLFLLLGASFTYFGNVATIVAIISIIVSLVIGKVLDHFNRLKVLQYDALINSTLWSIRSMVSSVFGIIFVDSLFKINIHVRNQAFSSINYDLLAKRNQEQLFDEKIVAREIWVTFIISLNFALSMILVSVFGFQAVFIFAAAASLLFWLI